MVSFESKVSAIWRQPPDPILVEFTPEGDTSSDGT